MTFSKIVKQKMKEKNLKMTDVARKVGYSYMYCIDLTRGRRRWNEDTMNKFSKVLGIEINFVDTEEPSRSTDKTG